MNAVRWMPIEIGAARSYARSSLRSGSAIAAALASRLASFQTAAVAVPAGLDSADGLLPDQVGHGFDLVAMRAAAAERLFHIMSRTRQTLVVEDDLLRQGDRSRLAAAYVGERVVHWCESSADIGSIETLLALGSSGYPLNAYLCHVDLVASRQVDDVNVNRSVDTADTVVLSVFDAESFLMLRTDR